MHNNPLNFDGGQLRVLAGLMLLGGGLVGCTGSPQTRPVLAVAAAPAVYSSVLEQAHRDHDDLLSAGLGLHGLRAATAPALVDPAAPTSAELRRRAIWSNWRGIADFSANGFGEGYGSLPVVPGREYHALARLPGARQPHRLLLQLPDTFDPAHPCLLVTASSGSRGIYGAIAVAGGWALPRGCAVAYTDKGAGTDWIGVGERYGAAMDGRAGHAADSAFVLEQPAAGVAFKHAHSQDNPEAHWGEHVRQAAEFARAMLDRAYPQRAPFSLPAMRVIAVGLSNGGGAVLQAAGLGGDWLDGVVAAAPNVLPGHGGRALYDYASEAALLMPCALLEPRFADAPMARPAANGELRCRSLRIAGLLQSDGLTAQAAEALQQLHAGGWTDRSLQAAALSVAFDLWRSVAVAYAAAYTRSDAGHMPCGYRYASLDAAGQPRSTTASEQALWWSDSSGIAPAAGVALIDGMAAGDDPALPGLRCLRELWSGRSVSALTLRDAVQATRARRPPAQLPIVLLHGLDDGLVPQAFSSAAYADWMAGGATLSVQWLPKTQHFDAFLGLPGVAARYQPLLPAVHTALDRMATELDGL